METLEERMIDNFFARVDAGELITVPKMTYEEAKEKALARRFGPRALGILYAASLGPVNPYDYFGHTMRRGWAYAYFDRLHSVGLIRITETPDGRRGTWYRLS